MVRTLVVLSSDDNPAYIQYWPLVRDAWLRFSPAIPFFVHVGEDKHPEASINLSPISGIPTANIAKAARLLVAQSKMTEGCRVVLSDMDMIPLSEEYFKTHLNLLDDEHFFTLCADAYTVGNFYPICYVAANQNVWRDILNPDGLDETQLMKSWYPINMAHPRFCDETVLKLSLDRWNRRDKQLGVARGWKEGVAHWRLDRKKWVFDADILRRKEYVDAHMHPYGECPDFTAIEKYVNT